MSKYSRLTTPLDKLSPDQLQKSIVEYLQGGSDWEERDAAAQTRAIQIAADHARKVAAKDPK